jgi:hypothetical protein
LAGRYEPVVIGLSSGSCAAASSSRVRLIAVTSFEPPVSDIRNAFVDGVGAASRMSMSSGQVCVNPVSVRFTSLITCSPRPETTQVDGYGVASPSSLIVIAPPLQIVVVSPSRVLEKTILPFRPGNAAWAGRRSARVASPATKVITRKLRNAT